MSVFQKSNLVFYIKNFNTDVLKPPNSLSKEPICKDVKRKLTGALFVIVKIGNNQFSADKHVSYQNQIHPKIKYYADIKNYSDLIS